MTGRHNKAPKILEWHFSGKPYRVTVHTRIAGTTGFGGFEVRAQHNGKGRIGRDSKVFTGNDLDALYDKVKLWIEGQSDITWTDYLLVEFREEQGGVWGTAIVDEGMALVVSSLQQGQDTKGDVFWRRRGGDHIRQESYEQYRKKDSLRGKKAAYVLLDDTPEVRSSLERFGGLLKNLREAIAKYVTKDKIAGVLAKIDDGSGLMALPAPEKPVKQRSLKGKLRK